MQIQDTSNIAFKTLINNSVKMTRVNKRQTI